MWIKSLGLALLFSLALSSLPAQSASAAIASAGRLKELAAELEQNLEQQQKLIEKLKLSSEQVLNELNEALALLKESEASLRRQITLSESLGNLIDDQATYCRKLERKSKFWTITSAVLAASLTATLIAAGIR